MSFYVSNATFFLLHCDEWDSVVALPRHKFVTGATLLQLVGDLCINIISISKLEACFTSSINKFHICQQYCLYIHCLWTSVEYGNTLFTEQMIAHFVCELLWIIIIHTVHNTLWTSVDYNTLFTVKCIHCLWASVDCHKTHSHNSLYKSIKYIVCELLWIIIIHMYTVQSTVYCIHELLRIAQFTL